jgi:Helix-turn-helix domain
MRSRCTGSADSLPSASFGDAAHRRVAKVAGCAPLEYVDARGVAWPSLAALSTRMGVTSERTVQKGLGELERVGLLVVVRSPGRVNRCRLTLLAVDHPARACSPTAAGTTTVRTLRTGQPARTRVWASSHGSRARRGHAG